MFYGSNVWDPVLIIAQIVSVQCLFYLSLGCIQVLTLGPTLGYITTAYIFDWATLHFSTKLGLLNWMSHVVNAIAGAAALAWLVERAKKCLDFGATCYIWHTIFVCWYSGWPQSFAWWLASAAGLLIMVLLGEWLCIRREMQDIPLSIPQRLSSGLLSRGRKESGQVMVPMMPLATDDPDQPPRPRLRTGLTTVQRSTAAAAAVAASSSSFSSGAATNAAGVVTAASPAQLPPATARPGSAVQLSPLQGSSASASAAGNTSNNSSGSGASSAAGVPPAAPSGNSNSSSRADALLQQQQQQPASRKKLLQARPASQANLATLKQTAGVPGGRAVSPDAL